MGRPPLGKRTMTAAERSARHRQSQAEEIKLLRRALLDALIVFDIGDDTKFHDVYAAVIDRAKAQTS